MPYLLAFVALVSGFSAAPRVDPKSMVLGVADMPAGSLVSQERKIPPVTGVESGYARKFAAVKLGSLRLVNVTHTVLVFKKEEPAYSLVFSVGRAGVTEAGRQALVEEITKVVGTSPNMTVKRVSILRHGDLRLGDDSVEYIFKVSSDQGAFDLGEEFVRVGRAVSELVFLSTPHAPNRSVIRVLLKLPVARMEAALVAVPKNTSLPTISGTPIVGHELIMYSGAWK